MRPDGDSYRLPSWRNASITTPPPRGYVQGGMLMTFADRSMA